jgi:hypothetical protein
MYVDYRHDLAYCAIDLTTLGRYTTYEVAKGACLTVPGCAGIKQTGALYELFAEPALDSSSASTGVRRAADGRVTDVSKQSPCYPETYPCYPETITLLTPPSASPSLPPQPPAATFTAPLTRTQIIARAVGSYDFGGADPDVPRVVFCGDTPCQRGYTRSQRLQSHFAAGAPAFYYIGFVTSKSGARRDDLAAYG